MHSTFFQSIRPPLVDKTNTYINKTTETADYDVDVLLSSDEEYQEEGSHGEDDTVPTQHNIDRSVWQSLLPKELQENAAWVDLFEQQLKNCGTFKRWSIKYVA